MTGTASPAAATRVRPPEATVPSQRCHLPRRCHPRHCHPQCCHLPKHSHLLGAAILGVATPKHSPQGTATPCHCPPGTATPCHFCLWHCHLQGTDLKALPPSLVTATLVTVPIATVTFPANCHHPFTVPMATANFPGHCHPLSLSLGTAPPSLPPRPLPPSLSTATFPLVSPCTATQGTATPSQPLSPIPNQGTGDSGDTSWGLCLGCPARVPNCARPRARCRRLLW